MAVNRREMEGSTAPVPIPAGRSGLPPSRPSAFPPIMAESPAMRRAVELAHRFAPLDLPVLLVGATGTGKEVLAQAIHLWSGRSGPLVDVNCGSLPAGMITNELFGHRRGAYTGAVDTVSGLIEQANHGTLFLDELASLPAEGQTGLLRVLETSEVRRVGDRAKQKLSVRLVAALQETVGAQSRERRLREDLYQRLAGGVIYLPPLRDRPEDLWPLALRFGRILGREILESARGILERHDWPGNVRELRHVVARAASLEDGDSLTGGMLAEAIDLGAAPDARCDTPLPLTTAELMRARHDLEMLCRAHGGRPADIAAASGVSRATLYRRLQQYGVKLIDHREGGPASQRLTVS